MSTIPIDHRTSALSETLSRNQAELVADWVHEMSGSTRRSDLIKDSELRSQCTQFLALTKQALDAGGTNFNSGTWDPVREMLSKISRTRAEQGFTPAETAMFVFSAKRPLFSQLRQACKNDAAALAAETWAATELLDSMGLYTTEIYQKSREAIIKRQQEELLELSTPVVKLWDGVLALPIIGTLDSARTQVVMESLLQAIVQTNSPEKGAVRWHNLRSEFPEGPPPTILTVDDNEAIRYTLVRSLRDAGFRVLEARTGTEALARAAENPDLITLDVNLPDIHGFDLCKKIKSNPGTAHIPILHLSSTFVDPDSRVIGLASGADAYLAEPIDRAELVATISALLRLKNAEMQARLQASLAEKARHELQELNAEPEIRVQERTRELEDANDSLRDLSGKLLQMQDSERRRIARELHDGVGQLLAAMIMNLAIIHERADITDQRANEALAENRSMAQEILRGIRTISHLLHPPLLDEAGLPSALRLYIEEFSQRSGIKVRLECDDVGRLHPDLETALFRVTQECLSNVHRHSTSLTANVMLRQEEGHLALEVKDMGRGIPQEKEQELMVGGGGVGLRGMRERIAQLGGRLRIESTAEGTRVVAFLPNRIAAPTETGRVA
ncbi:MAG TPA: RsbRD N-terminal domain-containing protein [Terriglobales bacterium]|nr:RsbRD N-terminal domain-containing protein [Terriglobales bacterium]